LSSKPFLSDVETLRGRARHHIRQGTTGSVEIVNQLLNAALAIEMVCVLRYKRHYFLASGMNAPGIADGFLRRANEEQEHADSIAARIRARGGDPDFFPEGLLMHGPIEYADDVTLPELIEEDVIAERIAIDAYREIMAYLGNSDAESKQMIERILADEEEHADDLVNLLHELGS